MSVRYPGEAEETQLREFLKQINGFKVLNRLDINCGFNGIKSPLIEFCFNDFFKSGFKNLTHLRIQAFNQVFDETIVRDFDKYFPKLRELVITN